MPMKKVLAAVMGLLPAVYLLCLGLSFLLDSQDEPLLVMMLGYCAAALAIHIAYSARTARSSRRFQAVSNLWICSVNFAFLLAEIILWLVQLRGVRLAEAEGAMGGGLGLLLLIILYLPHWFSYFLTRIVSTVSCYRALQGIVPVNARLVFSLLQLIPGADVISAVLVLRRVKKSQ